MTKKKNDRRGSPSLSLFLYFIFVFFWELTEFYRVSWRHPWPCIPNEVEEKKNEEVKEEEEKDEKEEGKKKH